MTLPIVGVLLFMLLIMTTGWLYQRRVHKPPRRSAERGA